jgi:hypothetical protein
MDIMFQKLRYAWGGSIMARILWRGTTGKAFYRNGGKAVVDKEE